MNTRTLLLSVSMLALIASPAAARNSAWYVGGDFGGMIVQDIQFDFGLTPAVPSSQLVLNHDYGYDGALFVGYDLGAFRIEAETAYKSAAVKDMDSSIAIPPAFPTAFVSVPAGGGRTSALSFMVNGMLDFGDDDGISGFVGGGIGVARVDYNNIRTFSNNADHDVISDSDTRFAWQVVAGVRQAVTDNIDITLRYRFFNADNIRTVDFRGFESDSRFRSHSLLGGITFNFGTPPPPPPPPAPPAPPATETPAETPH